MTQHMIRRCRTWAVAAVAAVAITGCAERPSPSGDDALEARVQHLEDTEAIRELLRDYGRHLDRRDIDAWAALFADDGEWLGGLGHARGREALRGMLADALPPGPPAPGEGGHHLFADQRVEVDGDRATAQSRWVFITTTDGRPSLAMLGTYDDELVRVDGRWLFLRRVVTTDIPHQDPLADEAPGR